jgi:hypothetical protein
MLLKIYHEQFLYAGLNLQEWDAPHVYSLEKGTPCGNMKKKLLEIHQFFQISNLFNSDNQLHVIMVAMHVYKFLLSNIDKSAQNFTC